MFASISMTDATDDGFTGGGNAAALLTEESEAAEEAEAPAQLLCQSCRKAALRAHETPDEGYDCDACGAAPTHWLCSGGCDDYEICNTCYEQLVAEGVAAAAAETNAAEAAAPSQQPDPEGAGKGPGGDADDMRGSISSETWATPRQDFPTPEAADQTDHATGKDERAIDTPAKGVSDSGGIKAETQLAEGDANKGQDNLAGELGPPVDVKRTGAQIDSLGPEEEALLTVTFTEPGTLGLKLAPNEDTGFIETIAINPGTQAEYHSSLQPGLIVKIVAGKPTAGKTYNEVLAMIKAGDRPLEMAFVPGGTLVEEMKRFIINDHPQRKADHFKKVSTAVGLEETKNTTPTNPPPKPIHAPAKVNPRDDGSFDMVLYYGTCHAEPQLASVYGDSSIARRNRERRRRNLRTGEIGLLASAAIASPLWAPLLRKLLPTPTVYLGFGGSSLAVIGMLASLRRYRSFFQLPRLFRKANRGGTVPSTEAGNVRTAVMVGLLWGGDKVVGRVLKLIPGLANFPSSIAALLLSYAGPSVR